MTILLPPTRNYSIFYFKIKSWGIWNFNYMLLSPRENENSQLLSRYKTIYFALFYEVSLFLCEGGLLFSLLFEYEDLSRE